LVDVYLGPAGVLTGTARAAQETKEKSEALLRQQDIQRRQRQLAQKRKALEAEIVTMRAQFEAEKGELEKEIAQQEKQEELLDEGRAEMIHLRKADSYNSNRPRNNKGGKNAAADTD
jgi:circadian clock protein KaiC